MFNYFLVDPTILFIVIIGLLIIGVVLWSLGSSLFKVEIMFFFSFVVLLIACGIVAMIKGIRGTWDQDVKPEDVVGPGNSFDTRDESKDSGKMDKND